MVAVLYSLKYLTCHNTITPSFVEKCSLNVEPLTDLVGRLVTCVGLDNALTLPLGYIMIWVQVDGVQGYDEDQIALVILDLSNFAVRVPVIWELLWYVML